MRNYCSSFVTITLCLCLVFSFALKGDANVRKDPNYVYANPNPFDPNIESTTIYYYIYKNAILWLRIYDVSGNLVRILVQPGSYCSTNRSQWFVEDVWDGRDDSTNIVPVGSYPYQLDDIAWTRTIIPYTWNGYDPYDIVVDPTNDQKIWATESSGKLQKSVNGGGAWAPVTYGGNGPAYGMAINSNGQKIYILDNGALKLFYSTDGGTNWNNYSLWSGANNPRDIACSSDGTILYAVDRGTNKVYKSVDSGANWDSGTQPSGAAGLMGIAVDPNDSSTILVADISGNKVYKSVDGGSNFTVAISSINNPYQISIDTNGYYWVSRRANNLVVQYDSNNNAVMAVGCGAGTGNYQFTSNGVSLGIFATIFNGQGYLYVGDYYNGVLKKYEYDNYMPDVDIEVLIDTVPPAAVTDLTTGMVGSDFVDLTWTAPGDDGNDPGTQASSYDIRYSNTPITTDTEFSSATQASGEPTPSVQGSSEYFRVKGLESNTIYYFAIKSTDEHPNTSNLSSPNPEGKTGLLLEWNMVSCPLQPSPDDSNSVFGDDAGVDWIFYWNSTWTGSTDTDCETDCKTVGCSPTCYCHPDCDGIWGQISTIVPGDGIYLYSYKRYDPTDATGTDITDASYTLSLSSGWNLIGSPYRSDDGTNVNLSSCNVTYNTETKTYADAVGSGWIGNAVYIWNGSTFDFIQWDVAKLDQWKGYWIFAYYDLDLIIPNPSP